MPLHAEGEAPVGDLDRLRQRVELRATADAQALADAIDALVVMGLRGMDVRAGGPSGERAGVERDIVVGAVEGAGHATVLVVAVALGEVLVQRAAERDVHHLHPAADREHGQVAIERRAQQRDLEAVALGHGADRLGVRRGAVAGRIDVGSAGEDEPVEAVEQLVR